MAANKVYKSPQLYVLSMLHHEKCIRNTQWKLYITSHTFLLYVAPMWIAIGRSFFKHLFKSAIQSNEKYRTNLPSSSTNANSRLVKDRLSADYDSINYNMHESIAYI